MPKRLPFALLIPQNVVCKADILHNQKLNIMNKDIFIILFLLVSLSTLGQVNQYDKPASANFQNTYVSPDFDMI